jgi:hypothetical protein
MQVLSNDASFPPLADSYNGRNATGGFTNHGAVIRWLSSADPRTLAAINRVFADVANRFQIDEAKINEIINAITSIPGLAPFDNSPYALVDGSHPFTAPVSGQDPTASGHLATKAYVDAQASGNAALIDAISTTVDALSTIQPRMSGWVPFTWTAGFQQSIDLALTPIVTSPDNIVSIALLEKLNVGTLLAPVYKYHQLFHGTLGGAPAQAGWPAGDGMHVDDYWLQDRGTVRVLIPSQSSYAAAAPSSDYNLAAPIQRWIKAVVSEYVLAVD